MKKQSHFLKNFIPPYCQQTICIGVLASLFIPILDASAIIIRDDVADENYVVEDGD